MKNKMSLDKFKKNVQSESVEQRNCLEFYARSPYFNMWRCNSGAAKYKNRDGTFRTVKFGGVTGISDLMGYFKGNKHTCSHCGHCESSSPVPFFHEVKRAGKKPTQAQKEFLDSVSEDGCYSLSGTFDDLMRYVEEKGLRY